MNICNDCGCLFNTYVCVKCYRKGYNAQVKLEPVCESKCAVHCETDPTLEPERCGNCRYFKPGDDHHLDSCVRYPNECAYHATDWCGEWRGK